MEQPQPDKAWFINEQFIRSLPLDDLPEALSYWRALRQDAAERQNAAGIRQADAAIAKLEEILAEKQREEQAALPEQSGVKRAQGSDSAASDTRMSAGSESGDSSSGSASAPPPSKVQRTRSPPGETVEQTRAAACSNTLTAVSSQELAAWQRDRRELKQLREENQQLKQLRGENEQLKQQFVQLRQQSEERFAKQEQQIAELQQQVARSQQKSEQKVVQVQQVVAAAASCVVACPPAAPVPHAGASKQSKPIPQVQQQQQQQQPASKALSFKAAVEGTSKQQQDVPMRDVQSTTASVVQKKQQRPMPSPAPHKAAGEEAGKQKHGAATPRAPRPRGQPSADYITHGKSFFFTGKLAGVLGGGGDLREAVVQFMGEMMPAGKPWGVVDAVRRGPAACPTVLITVGTLGEAERLIQHRHKLKGSGVTLYEVLSADERRQHAALWPAFVAARRQGKRAQFRRAELFIEGVKVRPAAT